MSTEVFSNSSFQLTQDAFIEGSRSASVSADGALQTADGHTMATAVADGFPKVSSSCAMLDAMYGIAVRDHERLTISPDTYFYVLCNRFGRDFKIPEGMMPDGSVFWAGYGFNTYLYTRDTAFSSWLGTAYLQPDVVQSHLQYLRRLRRTVGLKVSQRHDIPIPGIPVEQLEITEPELAATYNTNSYTRRTDDIVWVHGLWEVYKSTQNPELLRYLLDEFAYFDEHFYRHFFDAADGLYRGQPTFIDVGGPCYPDRGPSQTILLKALSTNGLYAAAFEILETAAGMLGEDEQAAAFAGRRSAIAGAITRNFGAAGYPFYKFEDGSYSDRQEILGLAFLALFDLVPREEAAGLLTAYPDGDYGRPLVWPFYGSKSVYHDNSMWPFSDTIFALAEYKVGDKAHVIRKTLAKLCRHGLNGDFNEVLEFKTGAFVGCPGYIWSAASYLALVYRMIAGMDVSETGTVTFSPVLPVELGNRFELQGLRVGGAIIDLEVTGNGDRIASCRINGENAEQAALSVTDGKHSVEVALR